MTRRCTINGCTSRSDRPEHRGVTFHSFPFDSKTRDIWISNCKISPDKNITKSVSVCSRHFRRADFTSIKGGKYTLKSGSVPTIFPWGKIERNRIENDAKVDVKVVLDNFHPEQSIIKPTESGGIKRTKSDDDNLQKSLKLGIEEKPGSEGLKVISKKEPLNFVPGVVVEAQDFDGVWHMAKIDEVDSVEREVLLKFEEKNGRNYNKGGTEEWIPMNSSRLRPYIDKNAKTEQQFYTIGERVMARWTGARKFPATISKVFNNGTYEVLFDDNFIKIVKSAHVSKMKQPKLSTNTPVQVKLKDSDSAKQFISTKSAAASLNKTKSTKKSWPLISRESLNLEELNLPHIPQDGEWCCHWVNDQPIGKEGFLMVGDHKKPTVIVEDWRLPPGWVKHMYQRSNVLGKWDVILVSPQGKRFRSKSDLKQFIEEQGQVYNPDVYDFSIHRRRAKDINAYVFTKDYEPPPAVPKDAAYANVKPIEGGLALISPLSPLDASVLSALRTGNETTQKTLSHTTSQQQSKNTVTNDYSLVKLEDGWVYVGGLKVQIIDNLFRCPEENCNKNFRKENHLQIHVKHYHSDLAKLLGECPNMQELALKRTSGEPLDDVLPKNHLPNAQFFARVHQQEIQAKKHRDLKTASTSNTLNTLNLGSRTSCDIESIPILASEVQLKDNADLNSATPSKETIYTHPTGDDNLKNLSLTTKPIEGLLDSTIKGSASRLSSKSKKNVSRKSARQRTTKKFLHLKNSSTPSSDTIGCSSSTNLSPRLNELEETRHSFNATPEISKLNKKLKNIQNLIVNESIDGNSHTTSSFPDPESQSPQYVRENGELIKIVKMRQEEIINCLCAYTEEDGLMIQCELCLCWQHGICYGIEKESQVPEKYICYICKNPQRGRESMKYIHDQDWLFEGKLPVANYHANNPTEKKTFDLLKESHILTGNLLETKRFLHSLRVKMKIAGNKDHPKMYLWAKKWEEDNPTKDEDANNSNLETKDVNDKQKDIKQDDEDKLIEPKTQPTIPQPEAPIEPVECQTRLIEHIKLQQQKAKDRLDSIEKQISEIEILGGGEDLDDVKVREILSIMIKDLTTMKKIAKINTFPKD